MDLFEVIDDRVVAVPNQTGLFSDPLRVSCRRNAVIRVVEGPASLPVGAEDLGAAAILLALGTFLCNKGSSGVEVPEGACRRCGPVSLKIQAQKKAIWRSLVGGGLDPEDPDRPL